jgi:hypothetical protein
MNAWEVKDGFDAVYCETQEDALMVADVWRRRAEVIREIVRITIAPVEITDIPESERRYVEKMRASRSEGE